MLENLQVLSDDRIAIVIDKCGLCNSYIEGVEYGLDGTEVDSLDSLLYKLTKEDRQGTRKLNFKFMNMQCPRHKKLVPNSTWKAFNDEEMEKINNTPLSKIYLTVVDI